MPAANSLNAVDPKNNATVAASAGSGKTWLLVTRIIRLLLEGAKPGGILALTFTRKAAGEMQLRLQQRLQEMATAEPAALDSLLQMTGAKVDRSNRTTARVLYEKVMHADFPVRLQTFHSFCQEILGAFPLEAEVPPGFELLEDTALLEQQAREQLFADTTADPDSGLSAQFDILMQAANGPANTYSALDSMLDLRSDWWAFTEGRSGACGYAVERLKAQLGVDENTDPYAAFFRAVSREDLLQFAELLRLHRTGTNTKHAQRIENALASYAIESDRFSHLLEAFLTAGQTPRVRKATKAQAGSMGEQGQARFLELHETISDAMLDCLESLRRSHMVKINTAWYRCGNRYIEHFQEIKRNLRVLDFNDLEWACYRLLKAENNAQWVQYKIDQRIDHVLVDEFQDTNPTQWQLILPILQEISAGDPERCRSIFLVGDEKQSIYQFRRANPALQRQASDWLHQAVAASATPLDASRRSSPVIMQAVNAIFSRDEIKPYMPDFSEHSTHLDTPGEVRLLPLIPRTETGEEEDIDDAPRGLRNPLLQPRPDPAHDLRDREAERLAAVIEELVAGGIPVITNDARTVRKADYGDILVLFRNRTHIAAYEAALRRRAIPFLGSQRGSLLANQEIEDMEKLLRCLITPFNNLDIAQVLKSPVFDASEADLARLAASGSGYWYQRLQTLAEELDEEHPLKRAARLLPHWQRLASTLPVHDLLDRIFSEGNIIKRCTASVNGNQIQRVAANLQRFHEMSLEHNSGRYPGLSHFLHHLDNLRSHSRAKPDEPVQQTESRIRLMTIHASKGLEAPVVILADADSKGSHANAWTALVDWPAEAAHPQRFQLLLDSKSIDSLTADALQQRLHMQTREEFNLLYVALTRARQYLLISATQNTGTHSSGWYTHIAQGLGALADADEDGGIAIRYGAATAAETPPGTEPETFEVPGELLASLRRPLSGLDAMTQIRPSRLAETPVEDALPGPEDDEDGALRGRVIHRALDLMSSRKPFSADVIRQFIRAEFPLLPAGTELDDWMEEAGAVIGCSAFDEIFRPAGNADVWNETPVTYRKNGRTVSGVIDRLVMRDDRILIIDYKTHPVDSGEQMSVLLERYRDQLNWYRAGIEEVWPAKPVRSALLFTHCRKLLFL